MSAQNCWKAMENNENQAILLRASLRFQKKIRPPAEQLLGFLKKSKEQCAFKGKSLEKAPAGGNSGRPAGRSSMCSKSCRLSIFATKNENTDTGKRKLQKAKQNGKASRGLLKSKVFS